MRMVDCDIFGWAFDSGPSPVLLQRFTMENCRFYKFSYVNFRLGQR
jgi:hypothetical protein